MNAPLSRYLTHFSPKPVTRDTVMPAPFEPRITLTAAEFDERLASAGTAARSEIEAQWQAQEEAWQAEKEAAVIEALAAARAEWASSQSETLAAGVKGSIREIRDTIADGLVRALLPLLSENLRTRVVKEVCDALEKLLSAGARPIVSVRGPSDLIEPIREQCGAAPIEWIVADDCEVTILAEGSRIETCLSAALADLSKLTA